MTNKKPTLIALLTCEQVLTEENGKNSLIGIFTIIYAQKFPARHNHMVVFTAWLNNKFVKTSKVDVLIIDPAGNPLEQKIKNHEVAFQKDKTGTYAIFNFNGVVFPSEGTYQVRVVLDNETFGEIPLTVEKLKN